MRVSAVENHSGTTVYPVCDAVYRASRAGFFVSGFWKGGYMPQSRESENNFKRYVRTPDMVCFFGKSAIEKERATLLYCLQPMASTAAALELIPKIYDYIASRCIHEVEKMTVIQPPTLVIMFPHEQIGSDLSGAAHALCSLLVQLHKLDKAQGFLWNADVSPDPHSEKFSFSIATEAFFVPFLYPHAHAPARRAPFPTLVFNTHKVFELLRLRGTYEKAKTLIRSKQLELFGFVPELLANHGEALEFPQYLLPPKNELPLLWDTLAEVGGEHPFGM